MAYKDFSIESAISPTFRRPSLKIQGVANAVRVMQNPSRSTEEFIQGAITSIGEANKQILYVNSSLEALNDRLRIASKIAYAVNTSKRRGAEGFNDVPMMDPWAFALEEDTTSSKKGGSGFFSKLVESIRTACRRIITALANLIRYIGNAIASADVKSQIKHYKLWKSVNVNNKNEAEKKAGDTKFKAPKWKLKYGEFKDFITKCESEYAKLVRDNSISFSNLENLESSASKYYNNGTYGSADVSNKILKDFISSVFGNTTETKAHKLVVDKCCSAGEEITCKEMKSISGDFECLSEKGLAKIAKDAISTVHDHQKQFTTFTKNFDKFIKTTKFATHVGGAFVDKDTKATLKNTRKEMSVIQLNAINARVRCNSFATSLMLEVQMISLRFNKSAHIALKHYLRAANALGKEDAKDKSSTATENYISTESLFQF